MDPLPEYESYDGLGLADLVRRREVRASEVIEAAITRIEARNPAINAVIHTMFEQARRTVSGALPGGPFLGVPFLLKDLLAACAGEPLTSSCRLLAGYVPDHDSELVARHRRAGLVILGKTNTPEFGILGVTEPLLHGPTRNPWQLEHTPGGSSGGAAAAVAAGMVPIAHGGDGGGSIRIPASCCGVFGLKPSRGRNPLGPDVGESWCGMVQDHALTRSVRDSAALLDATCGPDLGAPYVAPPPQRPFLAEVGADPGRCRIAFTARSLFGERTHPDCRAAVEDAAHLCEALGHTVSEAAPDFEKGALRRAYLAVVAVNTARAIDMAGELAGRRPTRASFERETWFLGVIGRHVPANEYQAALDHLNVVRRSVAAFFAHHDILLTPTLAHPPLRIGALAPSAGQRVAMRVLGTIPSRKVLARALDEMAAEGFEATANTMLFNQTGQPAMSAPLWWNAEGLPIGTQFAARYGEEDLLFRLAAQLEQARPWFDRRPPLATASGGPATR
ncbi:MAG: amidase [Thermoanaerobaculaceae bacterium]|nr:amidase [Thermoanaerobaculaceae bacterium]